MFEKVRTRRVYMDIVEQIQQLIKKGKLKPGDMLPPERILAEQLGVSRPPLREALAALEILGLIESRGGKGNIIKNNFDSSWYKKQLKELEKEDSPFEILEARKAVETQIAALAAKKATKEDIKSIQESLDKMRSLMGKVPEVMKADREFHTNIAIAAHNCVLLSIVSYLSQGLKERLWVKLKEKSWGISERAERYLREHKIILDAIKNKDDKVASRAMYNHLSSVEKDLLNE